MDCFTGDRLLPLSQVGHLVGKRVVEGGGDTPGEQEPQEGGEEGQGGATSSRDMAGLLLFVVLVMLMPGGRLASLSKATAALAAGSLLRLFLKRSTA